eukprot:CAMPEP_0183811246 /NCGR_PEP_ID=MMETSP0803_2-20130417/49020_1 /TAXON_ID=195967 /ORGANISM="Crustomastix stigmata, Strain CCMP3273" /LENGTH=53 /DNA_ID=CAMNT_0026056077 /DNA_START=1 /DNA_END=158 /DNA_ORIENTATION=+
MESRVHRRPGAAQAPARPPAARTGPVAGGRAHWRRRWWAEASEANAEGAGDTT